MNKNKNKNDDDDSSEPVIIPRIKMQATPNPATSQIIFENGKSHFFILNGPIEQVGINFSQNSQLGTVYSINKSGYYAINYSFNIQYNYSESSEDNWNFKSKVITSNSNNTIIGNINVVDASNRSNNPIYNMSTSGSVLLNAGDQIWVDVEIYIPSPINTPTFINKIILNDVLFEIYQVSKV